MPTSSSSWIARLRAACSLRSRCVRIVSVSWRPIGYSGLSDVSGSWNTAPISRPRTLRIASYGRLSMRRPDKRISPLAIRPGGSIKPIIAAPVRDLPAPDSPTTPSTSPGAIAKLTSRTATSVPRRVGNSTRSARTSSNGATAVNRRPSSGSTRDATAGNRLGLVNDRRPFGSNRILKLRIDVIALARLDIELHLLHGPGEATVARRFDGDRVRPGCDLVGHREHRVASHRHHASEPAIVNRPAVAHASDFAPRLSPRLTADRRERND